jgi:RHS repeat-associated protein
LLGNTSFTIGAGEIVRSETALEKSYFYSDALGSITSLADANGSLTTRSDYNAFGEQTPTANPNNPSTLSTSIGYTGQRLDSETGLMALGNGERYYSPSYARFIQQDSFAGNPSSPQSMNRFAYGYNNPNKYRDLNGNNPEGGKDETAEWLRETRKAVSNNSSGSWWTDFHSNMSLGIMETGYGVYKFAKGTVTELAYMAGDVVTEKAYDAFQVDDKNRVYSSSMYKTEQAKINGGMSKIQARIESAGAFAYGAIGGNLVEKVGGNMLALYDGRMDITDYNISQGEALGEALTLYAGAKSIGKATSKLTVESLKTGGTKAVGVLKEGIKSGKNALESVTETVKKTFEKPNESPKLKGQREPVAESIENHPNFSELQDSGTVMNPNDLNFSQRTAGGKGKTQKLTEQLNDGWDFSKQPADVIQVGEKLVTFDNTRIGVAQKLGLDKVKVKIHQLTDLLPGWFAQQRGLIDKAMQNKLPVPKTWGDALKIRTKDNRLPIEGGKTIKLKEE